MVPSVRHVAPLALALVLSVSANAFAQSSDVGVGLKVGGNRATTGGADVPTNVKAINGLTGGAFVSMTFGPSVGIQVEALFSQKGVGAFDGRDKTRLTVTYVDIPILLKVGKFGDKSASGGHVFVGPVVGLKVGAKATFNDTEITTFKDSDVRGLDLGITAGVGVNVGAIGLDARYTMGLRTIDSFANPDDIKNRVVSLIASYRFK